MTGFGTRALAAASANKPRTTDELARVSESQAFFAVDSGVQMPVFLLRPDAGERIRLAGPTIMLSPGQT